jgi:hypothetical protein
MNRAAAVLVVGCLVWGAVAIGKRPLPPELSPLRPTWDFAGAASPWTSRNSRLLRTPEGLTVIPATDAAVMASGQLDHVPAAFERMYLRLRVSEATRGRVGLVLSGPEGSRRALVSFDVPGGETFSDIEVSLPAIDRADDRVVEVVLVPSLALQPVVIASMRFEPSGPWWVTAVKELWSSLPGEATALSGFSMHTLPPPVINGRSVWVILIPGVLIAGLALVGWVTPGASSVVRRFAWSTVVTVWGLGFLFAVYHQMIAFAVEVERFGDRSREEAYTLIDGVPLWSDMGEVARGLPPGSAVRFETDAKEDHFVSAFWEGRAAYYLYPVLVREDAPVRVMYYGRSHPPCAQIAPEAYVLKDAARYCLVKAEHT